MVIEERQHATYDTTSSSETGTLSGQTATSDLSFSSGSQDKCLVVEVVSSGNGGDDDDDDLTDDEDDDEDEEEQHTTSKTVYETTSDSSSYKPKQAPPKKLKVLQTSTGNGRGKRDLGDTGSSSSSNQVVHIGREIAPVTKPIVVVDDELSRLVDSLRNQLVREQQEATLSKHVIIHEARETIARNKSEEAWTAQQTVTQVEASVQLLSVKPLKK